MYSGVDSGHGHRAWDRIPDSRCQDDLWPAIPYLACLAESPKALHTTQDSILQSADVTLDMSGSLVIPGLMHVISNMVKTMFLALPFWQACIGEQATALATFLHHPWSRERFVATCLQDEYAVFQPLYASFPADLTRWRWGDVEVCLTKLLQLESSLRMAWRLDRLNYHEGRQAYAHSQDSRFLEIWRRRHVHPDLNLGQG